MQDANEGDFIIAKLESGEDFFEKLEELSKKYEIRSGIIVSAIGMFTDFEIGFFDGKEYHNVMHNKPFELVSLHGSIAYADGKFMPHAHVVCVGENHHAVGGHLHKAKVKVLNELVIMKLDKIKLTREKNPASGLMELKVSK